MALRVVLENPDLTEKVLEESGAVAKDSVMPPAVTSSPTPTPAPTPEEQNINVFLDGVQMTQQQPAYIDNGTVYLSMQDAAKALGKTAEWDGAEGNLYIGKAPDMEEMMFDVVEAYQHSENNSYYEMHSKITDDSISMTIAGVKYTDGCWFKTNSAWALYNLNEDYKTLSFIVGHCDGWPMNNATLVIYSDSVLQKQVRLAADMAPEKITLDVDGVSQLKIQIVGGDNDNNTFYGLAEVKLTKALTSP